METKQLITAFAIGLLALGFIRFIFTPHPEKAEDVIFVDNIYSEEIVNDPELRTELNDAAGVYIPLQTFDSRK
jgi:hypothetical protein